ncbi:N-acetyltransferase [Cordyceps fumosorosea ARSEF 2679]|uniref:N-acetyltransferase n=1 Tax=Cordyceps fumosorosea (strain ARSEF 2679) TaxID=1081104 RepID=A0A162J332_CORFA|nr:N-acetyltransferase [Cordyceps fumosorosea ARSEF 2679]OAA63092.1 N-acetyltransferase [Cordyceps fumosorosea ARSEF 2679]
MSLTQEQLDRTLEHVGYPRSRHHADPLRRLQQLVLRHVARVPFENVGIHYNPTHRLSLALDDLFDKIVARSKGGYCVELNALFAAVLRGLGYQVLTVGGRVRAGQPTYTGWSHMCLIVTVDGARYVVDVGYGADAAMQPIPLISGTEFTVLAPRRGLLEHRAIDQHTDPSQRLWVYSTRDSDADDAPWVEQYCFAELECFLADYNMVNYYTSTSPNSFFMPHVLAARALLEPDGEDEVRLAGVLTFFRGEVRRRKEGSTEREVLETVTTEAERIAALERWFEIPLTEEDRKSIFSTGLALDKKPE